MSILIGDVVLVIKASPIHPLAPLPGAVGTVTNICRCVALLGVKAKCVEFGGNRRSCYPPECLKRLEPPGDEEAIETEQEVTA